MVRTTERKLTFWLAGYYDDFTNAKAIPDDSNAITGTWNSLSTHAGNPLNGLAPYNPRYKYAWFIRGTSAGSGSFNGATVITAADRKLHNSKFGDWLTFDAERYNNGQYEGTAHIQFPDSKTNANRQKFDGATGIVGDSYLPADAKEGYLLFCNGYNTQGQYYAFTGNNDSSYGRDTMDWVAKESSGALDASAGEPDNAPAPTYRIDTHMAGVFNYEITDAADIINGNNGAGATHFGLPIHSLSKSPFLVQEVYSNAASGFFTTLLYQGTLNCKGDDDIFTIRICPLSNSWNTTGKLKLLIGNSNNPIGVTSGTSGDSTNGTYAIDYLLTQKPYSADTSLTAMNPTYVETNQSLAWDDYEFMLDFSNQRYQIFMDGSLIGSTTPFNAHPDGGRDWTPADFYGWELQMEDARQKASILIDRVGVCRYLNDYPLTTLTSVVQDITPIGTSLTFDSQVNSESTLQVELTDDENTLKLLEFFNGTSYADWSLLAFRDNIHRPFFRGSLKSLSHSFNATDRTPLINITAADYLTDIDHQIPVWELGEGGDADSTGIVRYNRQDSQNRISTYYFGATPLQVGNASLGYNEIEDGAGVWESHVDTRMRLRSAHPIQVYNDEDGFGINDAYGEWDDAIADGFATSAAKYRSMHSRWIQDFPKSPWFAHMFGKIDNEPIMTAALVGSFAVGNTTLTLDSGAETLANGGHIEIVDRFGNVDSGVVTSATYAEQYTDIQVAWLHVYATLNGQTYWNGNTDNLFSSLSSSHAKAVALVPVGTNLHHRVFKIAGSDWEIFNNEWGFTRVNMRTRKPNAAGTSTQYEIYTLSKPVEYGSIGVNIFTGEQYNALDWRSSSSSSTGNKELRYNGKPFVTTRSNWDDITANDGISQSYVDTVWNNSLNLNNKDPVGFIDLCARRWGYDIGLTANRDMHWVENNFAANFPFFSSFISIGGTNGQVVGEPHAVTNVRGGQTVCTLPATNFFQRGHSALVGNPRVNVLDVDVDFKHCYVLWADMRNDGTANADAYFRKENFGLMKPSSQNYELSLVFGDQNTDSGQERQEFVDLVAGEDYDIWEMGSSDPILGTNWSAVSGGSNTESDSKYHNWEDKAGSFVIIDTSKFFNLNTHSNGGMSGQSSGGRKEIGDYIVETEGFPILLDNYWKRATTTPANTFNYKAWTGYHFLTDNQTTTLREEIRLGDRAIQLTDSIISTTPIANANESAMTTSKIISEEKETILHFNTHGKIEPVVGVTLTKTDPQDGVDKDGVAFITGAAASDLAYLRDGHFITISSSTTNPTVNGTFKLQFHEKCLTGDAAWVGKIILPDPTTSLVAGTGTIEAEHTYKLNRLDTLGEVEKESLTSNSWDGSSYSGRAVTSAYLTNQILNISTNATANSIEFVGVVLADWINLGFRKGMSIELHSTNKPDNNGTHKILDIQIVLGGHAKLIVENITTTYAYGADVNIYDSYYNTNSAEWLINNKPLVQGRLAPNLTTNRNPVTGELPYHEGALMAISLGEGGYTDAVVYANASSVMPMRLMMQMQGFVKNKGSMTFNEHDKFRVTYLDSLTKNWLNQANLFGIPDLGTVPRTNDMNIGQKDAMNSGRAGTIGSVAIAAPYNNINSPSHGLVAGDIIEIISNDKLSSVTVAPYSTQYTVANVLTANIFQVESTNTSAVGNLGMWRKVGSVDTFGSVIDCRNTTIANIFSQVRQVSGVGDDHGTRSVFSYYMSRDSKPAFRPTYGSGFVFNDNNITISSIETDSSTQVSNVRVFYGSDGNYVDHPQASLGAKPRWEIIQAPELSSKDEALIVAKQEYEKQSEAPMRISCSITKLSNNHTMNGLNDTMLYNARFGYIADQSRSIFGYYDGSSYLTDNAAYWTSLRGGNLFTGIQNGLDGRIGGSDAPSPSTVTPQNNYHWYGANSVSYAVQVVHIPHGMPKTTDDTPAAGGSFVKRKVDGCLRVIIDIAPKTLTHGLTQPNETHKGTYLFRVHLVDYDFIATNTSTPAGIGFATVKSQSSVTVDSNGLYEIPVPSTYWANQTGNERILLSVNYDYLASLVKLRCGGDATARRKNAHDWAGASYASHNTTSIFPLGVRSFSNAGYWGVRAEYYAPRLNITDDLNFTVGTTLNYSNSRLNMSSEALSIKSLNWSIDGRDSEKLSLELERDTSRAAKGFASYILPKVDMGGKQKGGGGKGKPMPPSLNPPKGKGGLSQGIPKQGNRQDKYGDEVAGTRRSAALQPNTTPPRDNRPDGVSSSSGGNIVLGSSALSSNVNRRIKGTMDFNNSSIVGDKFSVLGQKKPTKPPRNTNADQSIDSFIIPEGGSAVMGSSGFTLAGNGKDGAFSGYASSKIHIRVPPNPQSDSIRVFGRVTLTTLNTSSTEIAIVYVTATCVETGDSIQNTVSIEAKHSDTTGQNAVFIEGNLRGADIAGNTIQIFIEREAGKTGDTARSSALSINNIQVASDTRSVSGKTKSNEFSYGL